MQLPVGLVQRGLKANSAQKNVFNTNETQTQVFGLYLDNNCPAKLLLRRGGRKNWWSVLCFTNDSLNYNRSSDL